MSSEHLTTILEFGGVRILILTLMIYAAFMFLRVLLLNLGVGTLRKEKLLKAFYFLQVVTWISFAFWSLDWIFPDELSTRLAVAVFAIFILLGLGWFVLRDLFAGIILKIQDAFRINQYLEIGKLAGYIKRVGHLGLSLTIDDSKSVYVPYRKIIAETRIKKGVEKTGFQYQTEFVVNWGLTPAETLEKLRMKIVNLPWCALTIPPSFRLISSDETSTRIKANLWLISEKYINDIESFKKTI